MKIISVIRANWKKTVFGVGCGVYGVNYGWEMYQISNLMREYSEKAAVYGDRCDAYPRKLIVILNPAANKRKAEKKFTQYCEPILHLAGFSVDIVKTDSEGYAKMYVEQLKSAPFGIVIAGGDGSVSEVLTGLMRRNSDRCPIALLPLGKTNETAKNVLNLNWSSKISEVEALLNASLNIAREKLEKKSILKIEPISNENGDQAASKPIYSMGSIKWGIYRDIKSLQEKYWFFWKADEYFSAFINSFNKALSWDCKADLIYTTPCIGCSNCMIPTEINNSNSSGSFFSRLFSTRTVSNSSRTLVLSSVKCKKKDLHLNASNVRIYVDETPDSSELVMESDENIQTGFDSFLKLLSKEKVFDLVKFRTMNLTPDENCIGPTKVYSIDGETYDVRPIKVSLIPKSIEVFI